MKTGFLYLFIMIFGSNTQQSTGKSPERQNRIFNHCKKLKHEATPLRIYMRIFLDAPAYLFRLVCRMTGPEKTLLSAFISGIKAVCIHFSETEMKHAVGHRTEIFRCVSHRAGCLFLLPNSFFPKITHPFFPDYLRRLLSSSSSSAEKGRRREKGFRNEDMMFEKVFCSSFAVF